jgi:ferredoxin
MPSQLGFDPGLCVGHGRCYSLAPDVFEPDEEGHCVVKVPVVTTPDLEAQARLAVANCPEQALAIDEV